MIMINFTICHKCFQLYLIIKLSLMEIFQIFDKTCFQKRLLQICCMWERGRGRFSDISKHCIIRSACTSVQSYHHNLHKLRDTSHNLVQVVLDSVYLNPFPHIDAFWRLCSRQLFENIVTKTCNFSFCHNVFRVQSRLLQNCRMRERVNQIVWMIWNYLLLHQSSQN